MILNFPNTGPTTRRLRVIGIVNVNGKYDNTKVIPASDVECSISGDTSSRFSFVLGNNPADAGNAYVDVTCTGDNLLLLDYTASISVKWKPVNTIYTVKLSQAAADVTLDVSPITYNYPDVGENKQFTIKSNGMWNASIGGADADNFYLSQSSGTGTCTIYVQALPNASVTQTRSAKLNVESINDPSKTKQSTLSQDVADIILSISPIGETFVYTGESKVFKIMSNDSWTISVNNPTQFTLDKTSGSLDDTVTVTAAPNTTIYDINAVLTVKSQTDTTIVATSNLKLEKIPVTVSISPKNETFAFAGGSKVFTISSNDSWTISVNNPQFTLDKTSGTGDDNVTVTAAPNALLSPISAVLTVVADISTDISDTSTLTQESFVVSLQISPINETFLSAGEPKTFTITANSAWTLSNTNTQFSLSKTSGTGDDTVVVTAAPNMTTSDIPDTLTLKSTVDLSYPHKTSTLTQEAFVVSIEILPKSETFLAAGESKSFTIKANSAWTISTGSTDFVLDKTSGSGNDSVNVTVGAFSGSTPRTCTLTLVSTINPSVTDASTLTQNVATEAWGDIVSAWCDYSYDNDIPASGGFCNPTIVIYQNYKADSTNPSSTWTERLLLPSEYTATFSGGSILSIDANGKVSGINTSKTSETTETFTLIATCVKPSTQGGSSSITMTADAKQLAAGMVPAWGDIVSVTYNYGTNTIASTGGTINPTIVVKQKYKKDKTHTSWVVDGTNVEEKTIVITTDYTAVFSHVSGDNVISIDASGKVSAGAVVTTSSKSDTFEVQITSIHTSEETSGGEVKTAQSVVTQSAASAIEAWGDIVSVSGYNYSGIPVSGTTAGTISPDNTLVVVQHYKADSTSLSWTDRTLTSAEYNTNYSGGSDFTIDGSTGTVSYPINTTLSPISETFTLKVTCSHSSSEGGSITQSITANVSQSAGAVSIDITPTSENFAYGGEGKTFHVKSNDSWTVVLEGTDASSFSVAPTSGTGNDDITVTASPNEAPSSRSAIVKVISDTDSSKYKSSTLSQQKAGVSLSINPPSFPFTAAGGTQTFTVTTNLPSWTVSIAGGAGFTIDTSLTTSTSFTVIAAPNTSTTTTPSATITVSDGGSNSATATVTQEADSVQSLTLTCSPKDNMSAAGGVVTKYDGTSGHINIDKVEAIYASGPTPVDVTLIATITFSPTTINANEDTSTKKYNINVTAELDGKTDTKTVTIIQNADRIVSLGVFTLAWSGTMLPSSAGTTIVAHGTNEHITITKLDANWMSGKITDIKDESGVIYECSPSQSSANTSPNAVDVDVTVTAKYNSLNTSGNVTIKQNGASSLEVNPSSWVFEPDANGVGEFTVTFSGGSADKWSCQPISGTGTDPIRFEFASTQQGYDGDKFKIKVRGKNISSSDYTATVMVSGIDINGDVVASATVTLRQKADYVSSIELTSTATGSVPVAGGNTADYISNVVTAHMASGDDNDVTSLSTITYDKSTIPESTSTSVTPHNIVVSASYDGKNTSKNVTLNQDAKVVSLSVTPTTLSFVAGGESKTFDITCNDEWTISVDNTHFTLSHSSGVSGYTQVTVTAASSTTTQSGIVTITSVHDTSKKMNVNLSQTVALKTPVVNSIIVTMN